MGKTKDFIHQICFFSPSDPFSCFLAQKHFSVEVAALIQMTSSLMKLDGNLMISLHWYIGRFLINNVKVCRSESYHSSVTLALPPGHYLGVTR